MGLARLGSSYLARLCQLEKQLFLSFFDLPDASDGEETKAIEGGEGSEGGSEGAMVRRASTSSVGSVDSANGGRCGVGGGGTAGLHVMLVDLCNIMYVISQALPIPMIATSLRLASPYFKLTPSCSRRTQQVCGDATVPDPPGRP